MKHETVFTGVSDIPAEQQIIFPEGLPGLPDRTRFAVLFDEENYPFYYLQSLEDANLCFVTVDPFAFFPDYDFKLPDAVVKQLEISSPEDLSIKNIVVIADDFKQSTVNLQAPVVINHRKRLARQVILNHPEYAVKQRLFPAQEGGRS